MKTAVILLNYNNYLEVKNYANLLNNYDAINKIIVVDNHSTGDDFIKLCEIKSDKIEVIQNNVNGGYASGNNLGLRYLDDSYDYVIISNSDVYVDENSIKKCLDYLENCKDVAIAAPRMFFKNGKARRSSWRKRTILIDVANSTRITQLLLFYYFKKGEYTKKDYLKPSLDVDCTAGSFFVARYKYFKEVGFFDENTFLFYEEDILGVKLKDKGYKITSLNEINFIHYESQTIGRIMNYFNKIKILFKSKIYFQKEYNHANKFQILIFYLLFYIRMVELVFEIPIKKLISKVRKIKN